MSAPGGPRTYARRALHKVDKNRPSLPPVWRLRPTGRQLETIGCTAAQAVAVALPASGEVRSQFSASALKLLAKSASSVEE
jgi:hypothetical protein